MKSKHLAKFHRSIRTKNCFQKWKNLENERKKGGENDGHQKRPSGIKLVFKFHKELVLAGRQCVNWSMRKINQ